MVTLLQAEISQAARTVGECTQCTAKLCTNADDKEWCASNCDLNNIASCLEANPKINTADDANRYGNIERLILLDRTYKKFPLSKYFLNLKEPEAPGRPKDGALEEKEKQELEGALKELEGGCQNIVSKLEYGKGENISKSDLLKTFNQIKELSRQIQIDFTAISKNLKASGPKQDVPLDKLTLSNLTSSSTRYEVKIAFDKASLNLKNCFNQGEGAIFKVGQKKGIAAKILSKFNCSLNCTAKKCMDITVHKKCIENCPAYQIESCIGVGAVVD